jgi:hypothetical protein
LLALQEIDSFLVEEDIKSWLTALPETFSSEAYLCSRVSHRFTEVLGSKFASISDMISMASEAGIAQSV